MNFTPEIIDLFFGGMKKRGPDSNTKFSKIEEEKICLWMSLLILTETAVR